MFLLPDTTIEMPHELSRMLKGYSCVQNYEGCSQAVVFQCKKDEEEFYLKIEQSDSDINREYSVLKWLNGKLSVPEVKYFDEYNGLSFMLTTAMKGQKAGIHDEVCEPYENTIKLLADGLLMVQRVDITDCPFVFNQEDYDVKFQNVLDNIEIKFVKKFVNEITHKYAEMERIGQFRFGKQTDRPFETPTEMYNWLIKNKPSPQEERCFTHGDYGLTNTFIDNNKVTGFIDMGGGGINYKWHDIAVCVRSIGYHSKNVGEKHTYLDLFFERLSVTPDWDKINYHIWFGF
ncbi:MAG: phosphotransferase [Oscillospiraceae bacterium]|nr:phosphotransferase [Oscillospiraceae bacterium]